MIPRRIAEHVRSQNWFAVAIDLAIVVLGVFIGLQVSNWNADRHDRALGKDYIARLTTDIELEDNLWRYAIDYYTTARNYGAEALAGFKADPATLDGRFLVAIYQASQIWYAAPNRATFGELQSTGRIDTLSDPSLRAALANHYVRADQTLYTLQQTSQYRRIARLYLDNDVQTAIREKCGDQWRTDARNAYYVEIPETCEVDIPEPLLSEQIAALHANEEVRRELQFHMSVLTAGIGVMTNSMRSCDAMLTKLREAQR